MKSYQRRIVFVDLDLVEDKDDIIHVLSAYNNSEYKLKSVNQHENKLVYTLEKEIEE